MRTLLAKLAGACGMSGHSKWSTIKHQKAAEDKSRGEAFGKLARAIALAAREGSKDPSANARLRAAIDKAREFNMPTDNIERAITRGAGGGEDPALEHFSLDAVGPAGIVLIVEGITDNRNRTISEIRYLLETHGGKLGAEGSSRWAFTQAGILTVNPATHRIAREDLELELIQAGAQDLLPHDGMVDVIVEKNNLDAVRVALSKKNIAPEEAQIGWVPKQVVSVPPDKRLEFETLLEKLDLQNDVQAIWSNTA